MGWTKLFYVVIVLIFAQSCGAIDWDQVHCSTDTEEHMPTGRLPKETMGRFPWIGVIQHAFYLGGKTRYAITGAVLIHPGYALAPAEDMAKIDRQTLANNTHFVVWQSAGVKYTMDVADYVLHPDYEEEKTFATVAIVELLVGGGETRTAHPAPVLPICLPTKGSGILENIYAVKMTDESGDLEKEVFKMEYVDNKDCDRFYEKAELSYKMMKPTYQMCAVSQGPMQPCVWDGGTALITRHNWGYWKLLGFGVRGPGCGAPARFVDITPHLQWIEERLTRAPFEELPQDTIAFALRRVSPVELHMYKPGDFPPEIEGQCNRKLRGSVQYKDDEELITGNNFVQGFYIVAVASMADFACVVFKMKAQARSQAGVWIEHHCSRDQTAQAPYRLDQLECFVYFKTTAYIEFRFFFSFKVQFEVTLYGHEKVRAAYIKPWQETETTYSWWPTDGGLIRWYYFVPVNSWWYHM